MARASDELEDSLLGGDAVELVALENVALFETLDGSKLGSGLALGQKDLRMIFSAEFATLEDEF